jgi:hypothetical protein
MENFEESASCRFPDVAKEARQDFDLSQLAASIADVIYETMTDGVNDVSEIGLAGRLYEIDPRLGDAFTASTAAQAAG